MIGLGVVLLLLGLLFGLHILFDFGLILLIVGVVFALVGTSGRSVGGRRWWY